jgi:steroid delta-isomerase-like uncharacterized protein
MRAVDAATGYLDAWNRRDPDAIAAAFVPEGSYSDPVVPDGLGPAATADYARGLFAGFPDLAFEIVTVAECGPEMVAVEWVMTGTNDGPYQGLPPSGRAVRLPGADIITTDGDRVRTVAGYFDTAALPRQLGLQVVVQPESIGPFSFGTSVRAAAGAGEPGAVSLTVLEARSDEEVSEVRERTRAVVAQLLETPGFISWLGLTVGRRMYTVTAWERPEDVARLRENGAHAAAMERLFASPGIAHGAQTGVWTAHRLNGMWVRCGACDAMRQPEDGRCAVCGAEVAAPSYW